MTFFKVMEIERELLSKSEQGSSISLLRVKNLRNIEFIELMPGGGFNFILGSNGAGKSSILEGVTLLTKGSSFRDVLISPLLKRGERDLQIFGRIEQGTRRLDVGIEKGTSRTRLVRNGENVRRASDIAREIPVLVHAPDGMDIVDGEPDVRRRFIDWGVFHVEHSHNEVVGKYQRALTQRNIALKRKSIREIKVWDSELAQSGEIIEAQRVKHFEALTVNESVIECIERLQLEIHFSWRSGWNRERDLNSVLNTSVDRDIEKGYTSYGPHRDDFAIQICSVNGKKTLSRGQRKLVALSLVLAQAEAVQRAVGRFPILLLDDLSSELDSSSKQWIIDILAKFPAQKFITLLCEDPIFLSQPHKLFHVEHGALVG